MFAGYTTYEEHKKKWTCTYENGHILSLSQWPMSTNWNKVSNSLVSSILRVLSAFVRRDVTTTRALVGRRLAIGIGAQVAQSVWVY